MALSNISSRAGQTSTRTTTLQFGPTHVKMPKGKHQATIVWLHGLGDNGYHCSQFMESFPLQNIKWICPTAPIRPVPLFARLPGAAWFDPKEISEDNDSSPDLEGLNATAEHVAQIFAREPPDVKLAIGGFSIGAAAALYAATHSVLGQNANTVRCLGNLTTVVVLSGWLPCYMSMKSKIDESNLGTVLRVKALHVYIAHGIEDDVVSIEHGERTAHILHSCGFQNLTWKKIEGLGHDTSDRELLQLCSWLTDALQLRGY